MTKEQRTPNCKKHPIKVTNYNGTLEELANSIGDLRYDKLSDFLEWLGMKIQDDASRDYEAGRTDLSANLALAATSIKDAEKFIGRAWNISKAFMKLVKESQLKPQEGEWISVKDRLPKDSSDILVYNKTSLIELGRYSASFKSFFVNNLYVDYITHWTPLLTPPKG